MYAFSVDPKLAVEGKEQLYQKSLSSCGKSPNSSVWSTPTPSYQQIAQSRHGAILATLGGTLELQHLQLMGGKDLEG